MKTNIPLAAVKRFQRVERFIYGYDYDMTMANISDDDAAWIRACNLKARFQFIRNAMIKFYGSNIVNQSVIIDW